MEAAFWNSFTRHNLRPQRWPNVRTDKAGGWHSLLIPSDSVSRVTWPPPSELLPALFARHKAEVEYRKMATGADECKKVQYLI